MARDSDRSVVSIEKVTGTAHTSPPRALPDLVLHPDFDTSVAHLEKLFNVLDTNGDGELSYEQMREGFEAMDAFPNYTQDQLSLLIKQIDTNQNNAICLSEFVSAIHEYAAQSLSGAEDFTCLCIDYAPTFVQRLVVTSGQAPSSSQLKDQLFGIASQPELTALSQSYRHSTVTLSDFLKHHREPPLEGRVRWLWYSGENAAAFVRIANTYNLHPLAIGDVLEDRGRSKVDFYDRTVHIMLSDLQLKEAGSYCLALNHLHIFVVGRQTVLTVEKSPSDFLSSLSVRIKYAGSKLRLNNSFHLVHAILDSEMDTIVPITTAYKHQLNKVYKAVHGKQEFKLEHVQVTQEIYRESIKIGSWLRPMPRLVTLLAEILAADDKELEMQFNDLKDNIETLREDAKSMEKHAKSLNEDFTNLQQYNMNQVIYFLTMVTTIFIPGQFLSGVYGMNFDNMPELHMTYAYYVWWACVIGIASIFVFTFTRLNLLPHHLPPLMEH